MTAPTISLSPETIAIMGVISALAIAIDPTGDVNRKTGAIVRDILTFSEEAGISQDVQSLVRRMIELIEQAAP